MHWLKLTNGVVLSERVVVGVTLLVALTSTYSLSAADRSPELTTRPLPMHRDGEVVPSPFTISMRETIYEKPLSQALKDPKPGSPEAALKTLVKVLREGSVDGLRELLVEDERVYARGRLRSYRAWLVPQRGLEPILRHRFDLGGLSYFVFMNPKVTNTADALRKLRVALFLKSKDGYRLTYSTITMRGAGTITRLYLGLLTAPKSFAPIEKPPTKHRVSLMPLFSEEKINPVFLSFRTGCLANFSVFDPDNKAGGEGIEVGGCARHVKDAVAYCRKAYNTLALHGTEEFAKLQSPNSAEKFLQAMSHPKLRGPFLTRRSVRYDCEFVVASEDTVLIFSRQNLKGFPRLWRMDQVYRSPKRGWEMINVRYGGPFEHLLSFPIVKERLKSTFQ